jgi:hypothetical protein
MGRAELISAEGEVPDKHLFFAIFSHELIVETLNAALDVDRGAAVHAHARAICQGDGAPAEDQFRAGEERNTKGAIAQ